MNIFVFIKCKYLLTIQITTIETAGTEKKYFEYNKMLGKGRKYYIFSSF